MNNPRRLVLAAHAKLGAPTPYVIRPHGHVWSPSKEVRFKGWQIGHRRAPLPLKPWLYAVAIYFSEAGEIVATVDLVMDGTRLDPPLPGPVEVDPLLPMEVARCKNLRAAEVWVQQAGGREVRQRYRAPGDAAHGALMAAVETLKSLGATVIEWPPGSA